MPCAGIVGETRGCGRRRPSGLKGDEYTDRTGHAHLIFSPNLNLPARWRRRCSRAGRRQVLTGSCLSSLFHELNLGTWWPPGRGEVDDKRGIS